MDVGVFLDFPREGRSGDAEAFQESLSLAQLSEELGFDSVWLAELHFYPNISVISAPLIVATAVATSTKTIRVGTAVEVLPLANPIRLAEEVATLDHVSGGRFDFGIGRSGAATGYTSYGIPYSESTARFWECLDVLRQAWTQDTFSHHGYFHHYENVTLAPKPFQNPYPPIRIAANSAETFPRAAQEGLSLFIGLRGVPTVLRERLQSYRTKWMQEGHPTKSNVFLRLPVYVAKTMSEAQTNPKPGALSFYRDFVARIFKEPLPDLTPEENAERAARGQRLSDITYEEILKTDAVYGTPDVVTKRILELKDALGLDGIVAEVNFGGKLTRKQVNASMHLFTQEVLPHLQE
ncbi:LLM class flavin-dependent oxidoreductase [SAR202 cluster bacterium AD-804-J14_MRT_500m]|nr:LLM class flavin-dependent oxidoreductase [SAR202 cluster bacterium AD-804-J14_MRT_500m]